MNLYSRSKVLASAVLVLVCAAAFTTAVAQRRKAHKLRATAVLEVTTDSAGIVSTRVIPITILDEGTFHEAGIYKATPQPMALDKGIVYEGQTSGIPVGYATILSSTNNKGWTGLGKWQLAEAKKTPTPPPVTTGDDRPVFHRGDAAPTPTPSSTDSDNTPAGAPDDADRPILRRRTPEKPEPQATPQPAPTPADG